MDILTTKIAERQQILAEAADALAHALRMPTASLDVLLGVAARGRGELEEAWGEIDAARRELIAMQEASVLLEDVHAQLDEHERAALDRALTLLCGGPGEQGIEFFVCEEEVAGWTDRLRAVRRRGRRGR
jgi:hypothetical protein